MPGGISTTLCFFSAGAWPGTEWVQMRFVLDLDARCYEQYFDDELIYSSSFYETFPTGGIVLLRVGVDWGTYDLYLDDLTITQVGEVDPPTMLEDLSAFIAEPTTGTVDPVMAPSLTAKVDSALAALARDNRNAAKVAANHLKALVNQVEAQTDKKISAEAAAEIITQANAIVSALGY